MRVIHIVHGKANPNGHNGISNVVYNLNKFEKLKGIESEIWAITDDTRTHYSLKRDAFVQVECYPRVYLPFGKYEIIEDLLNNKKYIDLVHFHLIWFYDKNIIANALKKESFKFIITTHGTYSKPHAYTGKRLIAKWLYEEKYLKMANEIHIITREEGTGLMSYGYKGRCFLAYNGIDLESVPKYRKNDFFKDKPYKNKIKILWLGVLREDKNIVSLIYAISMLPKNIRQDLIFILVGPDYKGNANKYLDLTKKLNCRDNFDYIGPLYGQDKFDAIESSDAFIMPSFSEVFSLAIIEAMACKKPILATRGCGLNYISDLKFSVICEPYPQDLCNGIIELLSLKNGWKKMGENARLIVEEKLNWNPITEVMIQNYKRIINGDK